MKFSIATILFAASCALALNCNCNVSNGKQDDGATVGCCTSNMGYYTIANKGTASEHLDCTLNDPGFAKFFNSCCPKQGNPKLFGYCA